MTKHFALTAAAFEGSLTVVAIVLGWLLGQPPSRTFHFNLHHAAVGVVATLPPLGLLWLCLKLPLPPLKTITQILDEMLVPLFRGCQLMHLAIIAALAGLGEEMLFRGVIQAAIQAEAANEFGGLPGMWLGLLIAAALFGLLHSITPTYALLAGLIGLYLGWLWLEYDNLLVPITVHALYDFVVLVYLVKVRGKRAAVRSEGPGSADGSG